MRIYTAISEEILRARKLLTEWTGDGFLTKSQYQVLEKETVSELRTANIFLRLVLFFFTVIIVVAGAGLFYAISRPSDQALGVFLLIFAAVYYSAAEITVSRARLYRYGIEEALAVCSAGFLCEGLQFALFSGIPSSPVQSLVPAVGAFFSLWIWRRFGFPYAFLAAMIFVVFLPGYWTSSHSAQHLIVAIFYAAGLVGVALRHSHHRLDYLDDDYSLVEAFLWLGIYLAINLKLSSLDLPGHWWGGTRVDSEFATPFYWTTWVLIWCLPTVVLVRGIRQKDRFVIAVGAITTILTFVSNKPYLGWQRHSWDPMILGVLLTTVAVFLRRWLARGPNGGRHGFTPGRLSGKDQQWLNVGSTVFGALSPHSTTPAPHTPDFRFGGGRSGGGGASGKF